MAIIVPFHPDHVAQIDLQPAQAFCVPADCADAASMGPAFTLIHDKALACFGVAVCTSWRAVAWMLLDKNLGRHLLAVSRKCFEVSESLDILRLEAVVKTDFDAGHRYARLHGFQREGTMVAWGPDGSDHDLYARIKK